MTGGVGEVESGAESGVWLVEGAEEELGCWVAEEALADLRVDSRVWVSEVSCRMRRLMASRDESVEVVRVASWRSRMSRVGRRDLEAGRSCVGRARVSMPRADSRVERRVSNAVTLERVCVGL